MFLMPWESKTVEEIRKEFVFAATDCTNFSELCREFGITRKTGYKWLGRTNFSDQSKKPKTSPNKTPDNVESLVLSLREINPAWGGKTIRQVLENQGYENLPCVKTCNNILKRNNCIDPLESLKHTPYCRYEKENCNDMWQTDFKGDFLLLDGTRCFPLTILDDCSRFSIMIDSKPNTLGVTDSFKRAFMEYGMPNSILSDNGWTFRGFHGGYTQFERWLMEHDILPIHGRIMHPQTQGKIERFHRSMKYELLKYNEYQNLSSADKALQEWRKKYNEVRPHQALGMKCPADVYEPSKRKYIDNVPEYEYSGENHIIKVNSWGYLRFDKWQEYLSETMRNTRVEVRHNPDGNTFSVCFRNFCIAEYDADTGKRINRNISRL